MGLYRYMAVTATNEIIDGEMDGDAASSIADHIHALGHVPLRVEEIADGNSRPWWTREVFVSRTVSRQEVLTFVSGLSTLLGARLPLDHALQIQVNMAHRPKTRRLLSGIRERVCEGMSLGDAMASTESGFPDYLIATVRAGQAGGALEDILARLAEFLERSQKLRDKVRSALIYPAILGVLAALSLVVLVTLVIPEFRPLFEDVGADLPLPTRVVMAAADFLETYWWLLLFSIVAGVLVIRAQLRRPSVRYKWDGWKLGLPLLGVLLTEARVAVFSRLMSTLVHNGIPLLSALELSRRSLNNAALIGAIEDVSERVREGDGLARPLGESGLFPDLAVDLIRVGEETGDLEAMLRRIADIHDDSVERRLAHLVALLVPVLTIGLGVIIAGVIVSILVAVLSINQLVF